MREQPRRENTQPLSQNYGIYSSYDERCVINCKRGQGKFKFCCRKKVTFRAWQEITVTSIGGSPSTSPRQNNLVHSLAPIYRVTSLVANQGWVDLDLGCSTTLLGQ